jgi:hypothetical protein
MPYYCNYLLFVPKFANAGKVPIFLVLFHGVGDLISDKGDGWAESVESPAHNKKVR